MNSFASKLLKAQREASRILVGKIPQLDPVAVEQSFLLRGGNFVGVRWQSGEWSIEWLLNTAELMLFRATAESARYPLELASLDQASLAGETVEVAGGPPWQATEDADTDQRSRRAA